MSKLVDLDKYRKDLLSAYDDVSMEFEVLDRQPLIQAIPLEKVELARQEIEKRVTYDGIYLDRADVLEILDKLIEEVER